MNSKIITTPQKRLDEFSKILDSLNNLDCPVVVEGKRDTSALKNIGSVSYTHLTLPTKA